MNNQAGDLLSPESQCLGISTVLLDLEQSKDKAYQAGETTTTSSFSDAANPTTNHRIWSQHQGHKPGSIKLYDLAPGQCIFLHARQGFLPVPNARLFVSVQIKIN
ncbi:hypothetical protein BTVI_150455 [Pitangus sulphuratus]|nr:hypothetical protein BTVI_150455 [Pitangus sulphuratus]